MLVLVVVDDCVTGGELKLCVCHLEGYCVHAQVLEGNEANHLLQTSMRRVSYVLMIWSR